MKFVLTLLALSIPGHALTLAWDASQRARDYRVWLGIEVVAVVTGTEATINVPSWAALSFTVTARNEIAESARSEPLNVCLVGPTVTLEFSSDLKHWDETFSPTDHFARARKDYP